MSKEHLNSKVTTATLLIALGIIYGDIGTSPLYALRAVIGSRPISYELVMGGVSCILWTLIFQTTIKYIWLTLKADNQGEGGIFALFSIVRRFNKRLVFFTILGATTLLADGIITPPISVSSAIEGLNLIKGIDQYIVPGNFITVIIVIIILSILFFSQRFGTKKIGGYFGPVMAVWFLMLGTVGFVSILGHPNILKAINPLYAFNLLMNYPNGFWLLGAVFLCTTGAEALYSDLGHCGLRNIRITWIFVKTTLVLNYFGQAAWLLNSGLHDISHANPFFDIIPHWFLIPGIIIATLATIIASQALISGSYTLINEAMNLNFWPRVRVKQPTEIKGQIYIPSVNYILWIGCLLMVMYFKKSEHMEAAYGFSITITMLMTTLLMSYFLRYRLHWNKFLTFGFIIVFGIIEVSFFIANVAKIKERWMFLFFELFIFLTMWIWFKARKINNRLVKYVPLSQYSDIIAELSDDENVPLVATHLVYLTKANRKSEIEEKIIKSILAKKPKRADVYWFMHINRMDQPYTLTYNIIEVVKNKIYKININIGFRMVTRGELYFKLIVNNLLNTQELQLQTKVDSTSKYNNDQDFKFVIIEKFISVENEFNIIEDVILNAYFRLKKMSLGDIDAFGLDKSDVILEYYPLVYNPNSGQGPERVYQ